MNCAASDTEELIRLYYDSFNRADRPGMLRLLAADVLHEINEGSPEVGFDAFAQFLRHMDACYHEQVEQLTVMVNDSGSRAAAEFFIRGRYLTTDTGLPPATGQVYHLRVGAFFEVAAGRITRVTNHYNLNEWLRQISEPSAPARESAIAL